ncbi:MAG TPA: hypothetical protein ENN86_02735 [Desulfobacteraceae bacterium]|nr:hypothetical protein [Desulfobacteraceae bacterium]
MGQSTRTQSKTASASVGILDNIRGFSDDLEGDISYKQSQIKLLDVRNNAEREVRESVFNVEKALLQVKSSEEEVKLSQEEVVATQSKKDLNLAQISELISSKIKLANARKAYYEALSYFNISVASLNKSVGNSFEHNIGEAE